MSIEIAQLCKRTYNNQLQQSINLCYKRNKSQIWKVNTLWQEPNLKVIPRCTPKPPNQCQDHDQKVKSRSHHDDTHLLSLHIAYLHLPPMSLPGINFLQLNVFEIQSGQTVM